MRGTGRLALVVGLVVALSGAAQAVNIDWVTVGDGGNTADDTGYGAVATDYRIGTYEVTTGQYCEFLNAVAATDTYGLYNTSMWTDPYGCKIERTGSSGIYNYSVVDDRAARPVNYVSFWDAARFANWMHNGQPTGAQDLGTTEDGAYINVGNQTTFARQSGALLFIPTEDEWYKAAYYKAGGLNAGYWDYPTQSDTVPSNDLINPDPGNNATFYDSGYTIGSPYYCTEVGAHENSAGGYGTFDQGGNVWEWNETALGSSRGLRGGSWLSYASSLTASSRYFYTPALEVSYLGFRLASPSGPDVIPEPGTMSLFGIAVAAMLRRRRRRA